MRYSTIGLIITLTLGILVAPLTSTAQPPGKVFQIGFLSLSGAPRALDGLRQGLRALGYVEGQNLAMEQRNAEGHYERLSDLATDLVGLRVEVLVTMGVATRAAKDATSTVPIVMVGSGDDPVALGLIASLARPGGNITGVSSQGVGLNGKRLEILKEVVPAVSRIAALWQPSNPINAPFLKDTQTAAQALGVQLQVIEGPPNDFEGAFEAATSGRAEALIVLAGAFAFLAGHHTRIVDFAQRHRLPAMYPFREFVDAGGLMTYEQSWTDMGHRAATYVDKILQGAKPADLPVERATKFVFVINLKTAKALGITIPPHLLVLADEVLQ